METEIEILGWLSSVCFAACGLPQSVKVWRTRRADDLSWAFLALWFLGEIFITAYILLCNLRTGEYQWPLYANYAFNILVVLYLFYAKHAYPRARRQAMATAAAALTAPAATASAESTARADAAGGPLYTAGPIR